MRIGKKKYTSHKKCMSQFMLSRLYVNTFERYDSFNFQCFNNNIKYRKLDNNKMLVIFT